MRETWQLWRLFPFISILLLTLMLDSCQFISVNWRNRPEPERSILTGIPCSPPCWQGITPGVTTETEALDILHTNPVTKNATIDEDVLSRYATPELTMKLFRVGIDDVNLHTRNNVVELIVVQPLYQLQLGQLVARYGQPEKFAARSYPTEYPNWGFHVDFHYPQLGFVAGLHTAPRKNDKGQSIVAEDMSVTWLYYFPAGSMSDAFKIAKSNAVNGWLPMEWQQDWKGFGPIDPATPSTLATPAEITKTQSTPLIIPPVNETGLVPGKTTSAEVRLLVGDPRDIRRDSATGEDVWSYFAFPTSVILSNDIVQKINLRINDNVFAENIVVDYGSPEIIVLYPERTSIEPPVSANGLVLYPSRGVGFNFTCPAGRLQRCDGIYRKSLIVQKTYFIPMTIRDWLGQQHDTEGSYTVQPWMGFDD